MSLLSLIRKKREGDIATATLATFATHEQENGPTVATVATVAVANPTEEIFTKPDPIPWDNRRTCMQCANLTGYGCLAVLRMEIKPSWDHDRELLRRCPGYAHGADDPDQRAAAIRWPGLWRAAK